MAFGNKVTEYGQDAVGTAGYIIQTETISSLIYSVESVQAQDSATTTQDPVTAEVERSVLLSYLDDTDAPNLAWCFHNDKLIIFFNSTTYPYVDDTRFAVMYLRMPSIPSGDSSYMDYPDKDRRYLELLTLRKTYQNSGVSVPYDIKYELENLERELEDGV